MDEYDEIALDRIRTAKEDRLEELDLSGLGLGRRQSLTILSMLAKLNYLKVLNLNDNAFSSVPSQVADLHNLTSLFLSGNELSRFPEQMRELRNLTSLDLSRNKLERLPDGMRHLTSLTSLNVSANRLRNLPDWILKLRNLTSLDLSNNHLSALPDWIGQMTGLTILKVRFCRLGSGLPDWMQELRNLTLLDVSRNPLDNLPDWILKLRNLTSLDLSDTNLSPLPDWIGQMTRLTSLNVSSIGLERLPDWMRQLTNLTSLNVSSTKLERLPDWMLELRNLTSLDISRNKLERLPDWMRQLTNLTSLNISRLPLGGLPDWMRELTSLTSLDLSYNKLERLPNWMGELTSLTSLEVDGNGLESLPFSLRALQNLTHLSAGSNNFSSFPDVLYELVSLKYLALGLYGNQGSSKGIKEILPKILQLENLRYISMHGHPLVTPPIDIAEKGIFEIRQYFHQLEAVGVDHLYEAKLLIVGEGGAGKTSLAKKIVNPGYQLQDEEVSTKGIEVIRWEFTTGDRKTFRANIWDFGGQEIYHATHQFFLTKRSLYLLVADTRKEDTDFYYWLNVVELLSDNSPLLIVKNEKQDRHRDINERQLRGEFENLKDTASTNLATNRGLAKVSEQIRHHLTNLSHIGSPLPKTWVRVRNALERDPRNHIGFDEYLLLCERNGFRKLNDKQQLSEYLHDLGVCLHFQNDPLLKKTVILKPKWGTDAVYKVLDNKTVINNRGEFSRSELAGIWHEEEYADMRDELLQLMINFKLCYKIPGGDNFIAPQLLSENQPAYDWNENDNLLLRYAYEFMPKGILTQFIVSMQTMLAARDLVWRSGIILADQGTRAEVIEHYSRREIRIRVSGKLKKDLMTVVTYELDKIHKSYKRLKFKKLIPCNCGACRNSQEPNFYTSETLRRYLADGRKTIECQSSYQQVDVRGLVDDVLDGGTLENDNDARVTGTIVNIFNERVDQFGIQQATHGDNVMPQRENTKPTVRSPWASGSFYLFTFAVVVSALGVLANTVSFYALPIILIAGAILIPVIGALQLKQDDRVSDKSFLELMRITVGQLPLIGKLARPKS